MIEIINIFIQFFIFLIIFSFPLNINFTQKKIFKGITISFYDTLSINILIHLNLFLIISFFNIDTEKYFVLLLILGFFYTILNIRNDIKKNKFDAQYILSIFVFFIICTSLFFDISENLKLEWDALNHWIYKTSSFYNGHSIQNLENARFSEYPHLGTYIWAFFWKNSLLDIEYFGRLFYCFIYVCSIFSLINYILPVKNFFLNLLVSLSIIILTYDIFLFSGYQEYLIFSSLAIFTRIFLEFQKLKKINLILFYFFIIFSQVVIWFKDEALFYYIIIALVIILSSTIKYKHKIVTTILVFLFPFTQFIIQKYIVGTYGFQADIIHSSLLELLDPKIFFIKILLISKYIFISFIKYKIWFLNLISLLIIFIIDKKLFTFLKPWVAILILNFILIYAIYLHTPYNLEFLLKVTLDRLLFQTSAVYLVFPLYLFRKLILANKLSNRFI